MDSASSRRQTTIERLRQCRPAILPSLLLCDFTNLQRQIAQLEDAGYQALHLYVMDGRFVPNFTYGMTIVEAVRRCTKLPLDVHLMMVDPGSFIPAFVDAGADVLTVHIEAIQAGDTAGSPQETLQEIARRDCGVGIAINPSTPFESIDECLGLVDLVLVMSVQAGFGGQAFQPVALDRLAALRRRLGSEILLEVDGGVHGATAGPCVQAGADLLVAGSAIFRQTDYETAHEQLQRAMAVVS
ncbi:MAG: ribulose-phosphate 3-epimerase [Pirellulaceae bacterium]